VELWFIFFALLVAGLGLFAMFGYVRSETDKLELKHLLSTEQYKRTIFELEGERDTANKKAQEAFEEVDEKVKEAVAAAEASIEALEARVHELEDTNEKLRTSLDKVRRDSGSREVPAAQPETTTIRAV